VLTAKKYGADVLRTYICFLGPVDKDKPWSPHGIDGTRRFLDRVYRAIANPQGEKQFTSEAASEGLKKALHKTIKKVTEDIESMSFNTAISAMMILVNELYKTDARPFEVLKPLVQLLAPFAPHMAEELWEKLEQKGLVAHAPWPTYQENLIVDDSITLGVQVNGKMRGTIEVAIDASEAVALELAKKERTIAAQLASKNIEKVIYKAGKILNIIVK
jgi:leucyl-tRNA synthetase